MSIHHSFVKKLREREINNYINSWFQKDEQVTLSLIKRLGLQSELKGHNGCVNCLEWNSCGSVLASGSDDVSIILWDPFKHKLLTKYKTGHQGNIFSVKFLPESNDSLLVSGAADSKIQVHDINRSETTHVFSHHTGRVKRIATAKNVPFMFWSAAEDGSVMQYDLRMSEPSNSNPKNVLINLNAHLGQHAEAKCIAINPCRSDQLAVGANDPFIRLYDRRMLTCKSVEFLSHRTARTSLERQNHGSMPTSEDEFHLPNDAVEYFVAGHLPHRLSNQKMSYRTLATTYLTYSPDGTELLVNLGGEQIYLFDVNGDRYPKNCYNKEKYHDGVAINSDSKNGYHPVSQQFPHIVKPYCSPQYLTNYPKRCQYTDPCNDGDKSLPPYVQNIKQHANEEFQKQEYNRAIFMYNEAISIVRSSAILFCNRAAAYMKRNWDGDIYAAFRDCCMAMQLDSNYLKAHFRKAKCLFQLLWLQEAFDCLKLFREKYPDYVKNNTSVSVLDREINTAMNDSKDEEKEKSPEGFRYRVLSNQEKKWREGASDYTSRFCGHCNTTTDIKEANFFGSNGQFIVAGSDDGSFFIWDKKTTNIVVNLRGDESIVNCLQPHPSTCLLATSGIDPVVKLWCPMPDDGKKNDKVIDNSDDAASANQIRMNTDPLEVMLRNMGYRITGPLTGDDDDERETVQCTPS